MLQLIYHGIKLVIDNTKHAITVTFFTSFDHDLTQNFHNVSISRPHSLISLRIKGMVMRYFIRKIVLTVAILSLSNFTFAESFINPKYQQHESINADIYRYQDKALLIKNTFEDNLYTFDANTAGHYGLRLYRQTLDPKYAAAIWSDMVSLTSTLNKIADTIDNKQQAKEYGAKRLQHYENKNTLRSQLRYQATKDKPEYLFYAIPLLGALARADEYGLKHKNADKLNGLIDEFDFKPYVTDSEMIEAWAAQLANQVYWLRQLGGQDVVNDFITAFRQTYPDNRDSQLSDQQYTNKIYGLTHIIFAASGYYQHAIDPQEFAWIYSYFDHNIDQILKRTKEDVIAEVGISYLLANKLTAPALIKTQTVIAQAIDTEQGMIPSTSGSFELEIGEHRNVLAIMLLDWQGVNNAPTIKNQPEIFKSIPYGLIEK